MKPALVFVLVALGATVMAEAFLIRRQEKRLRELEASLARQNTPEGAAEILRKAGLDPAQAGEDGASSGSASRSAVDEAVARRTATLEDRLASLEKSVAAGGASGGSGGPGATPEELDAMVAKKVDEKIGEKKGAFGEEKKRPLADISKDLGLTGEQEDLMAAAIDSSQRLVFGIVTTPRNDGTNILDDLVTAMKDPEKPQEKATAVFMKLFTDKIPGSEETYLARIMAEKKLLNDEFRKFLTEDQMKKYERLAQDPHEIQTGYDPYGEYMAQRMGEQK